ncbi:MAG: phosphoglycolate phosphatase [Hyphomicrobium sp.]|nr:phosphoglycolate phosphatase [Hyphomicrobium sp.]
MRGLTVVFDLDGTLVDTAPDLVGATNHALADLGLAPVDAGTLRPWISFGARRMIVEALAAHGRSLPDPDVDRLLDRFIGYYEVNIARESRPYPGVVETVAMLRDEGATLAVCTNKRESLSRLLLDALALTPHFAGLAGRDTFLVSKPHPDHLYGAIRLAGGDPGRAVMVGDSDVDVATAKAAGIPVVAVSFGYTQVPVHDLAADVVIDHYRELPAAIAGLAGLNPILRPILRP